MLQYSLLFLSISFLQVTALCNEAGYELKDTKVCICKARATLTSTGDCAFLPAEEVKGCMESITADVEPYMVSSSMTDDEKANFEISMGHMALGREILSVSLGKCRADDFTSLFALTTSSSECQFKLKASISRDKLDTTCEFKRRLGPLDGKIKMLLESTMNIRYSQADTIDTVRLPITFPMDIKEFYQHMLSKFTGRGDGFSSATIQFFTAYPMTMVTSNANLEIFGGELQYGDIFIDGDFKPCTVSDYSLQGKWCQQAVHVEIFHNMACTIDAEYKITGIQVGCATGAPKEDCDLSGLDMSTNAGLEAGFSITTAANLCDKGPIAYDDPLLNIRNFSLLKGPDLAIIDQLFGNNRPPIDVEYMRMTFEGKTVDDVDIVSMSSTLDGTTHASKAVALAYNFKLQQFLFMHKGVGIPADEYKVTLEIDYSGVLGTRRRRRQIGTKLSVMSKSKAKSASI